MDISRLLSCSVKNNGEINREFNKKIQDNLNSLETENQAPQSAYQLAQKQLKIAISLQEEIDNLRLKLSDRWTDHLASNCQIQ